MTTKEKSFRNKLFCRKAIQEQKQTAEILIKEQLFKIVNEFDLENGYTLKLNEMVEIISNRLGLQKNKEHIAQYIKQILHTGKYKVSINDEDIIEVILNEQERRTKEYQDEQNKKAKLELAKFVKLAETYSNQLECQNLKINKENIKKQFNQEQREKDYLWIDLAIDKVLREREQIEL